MKSRKRWSIASLSAILVMLLASLASSQGSDSLNKSDVGSTQRAMVMDVGPTNVVNGTRTQLIYDFENKTISLVHLSVNNGSIIDMNVDKVISYVSVIKSK